MCKLLPTNGANAELLTNMIGLALELGDDDKVREYSEKLLRVKPGSRVGPGRIIAAAMARGDFKTAAQQGAQLVKSRAGFV